MFDWGANFRCVGSLACVTEFGHFFNVFIKLYSTGIYSVCGGCEKKKKRAGAVSKLRRGVSCGQSAGHMAEEGNKLTLRRLEAPIHKFIKVALPTDLDRLQKHHSNILKVTTEYIPWLPQPWLLHRRWVTDRFCLILSVPAQPAMGTPSPGADQCQQDSPGKILLFLTLLIKEMAAFTWGRLETNLLILDFKGKGNLTRNFSLQPGKIY